MKSALGHSSALLCSTSYYFRKESKFYRFYTGANILIVVACVCLVSISPNIPYNNIQSKMYLEPVENKYFDFEKMLNNVK